MADKDLDRINAILEQNKGMNFVQRILSPTAYPDLPLPDKGRGETGTHLMSYSEVGSGDNKRYVVYPTIVQDPKSGQLNRFPDYHGALNHAMGSGEFIPFRTAEEADWFSRNYKKVWDKK